MALRSTDRARATVGGLVRRLEASAAARRARVAQRFLLRRERVAGLVSSAREYVTEELGEPGRFQPLRDSHAFKGRPGRTLGQVDELAAASWNHLDPAVWRVSIPGGRVVGEPPLVLTRDRRALTESVLDETQLRGHPAMYGGLPRAELIPGRLLVLTGPWGANWYHWLLEVLPRAALLPLEVDGEADVLVPANLNLAQEECLTRLGVPPRRRRPHRGGHVAAEELVFPSFVASSGTPPRWALSWLRDRFGIEPRRHDRRLYVSRADAPTRRVVNEAALGAMLRERGFETVIGGKLGLEEQMRPYAEAAVVIGPHGAGLANLCATTDATVIELHRDGQLNLCYFAQANAQGLDYWYLRCEPEGHADLRVDLDLLAGTLDAAGID
jgi:Glycosyltransferase 61